MSCKQDIYERLGDYIREVDVRNTDLKVSKLVGLTIAKAFIPSVANTIGTDLSKYKIIKENQFACSLMQVSRDGKMPIAIYKGEDAIMSPAYPVFEVYKDGLLPDYLQMWFSRSEFDREAVFYAVGGVRGSLDWDDFMDMKLPIPTLAEQRRIVSRYQAIQGRIENNQRTIAKLEEAAQALYRKMFVDDIDVENLPEGWRRGCLTDIADYFNGLACQNFETDSNDYYPVLKIRELGQGHFDYSSNHASKDVPSSYIINDGDIIFSWSASLLIDFWVGGIGVLNQHLFKVTPINCPNWFVYFSTERHIDGWKTFISAKATSMGHIKREDLENAEVIIPSDVDLKQQDEIFEPIFKQILNCKRELLKLKEIQTIILSGMGWWNFRTNN